MCYFHGVFAYYLQLQSEYVRFCMNFQQAENKPSGLDSVTPIVLINCIMAI